VLARFEQCSNETQKKMVEYLHGLEARITTLPDEIEDVLNPRNLAELLGESIRQHFLRSGLPKTAEALQASSATIAKAEADLARALARLCDSRNGVLAEVESANRRVTYSLESRAKSIDALLFEVKHDILRLVKIWTQNPPRQPLVGVRSFDPPSRHQDSRKFICKRVPRFRGALSGTMLH
jgi:hypothetical protein